MNSHITFRIPKGDRKMLSTFASMKGQSVSHFVREAVFERILRLDISDEDRQKIIRKKAYWDLISCNEEFKQELYLSYAIVNAITSIYMYDFKTHMTTGKGNDESVKRLIKTSMKAVSVLPDDVKKSLEGEISFLEMLKDRTFRAKVFKTDRWIKDYIKDTSMQNMIEYNVRKKAAKVKDHRGTQR